MAVSSNTPPSLVVRLRDGRDHEAWAAFAEVYGPLIYGYARKEGLQDADAADLMQEVLRTLTSEIQRLQYDARQGSFRAWLFRVARNRLLRFWSRQNRAGRGTGDTSALDRLRQIPAREDARWEEECERCQFAWAAARVQTQVEPTTWKAFWMTAVDGQKGHDVAAALGVSVGAVYLAKSRVMARLKEQLQQIAGD